MAIIDTYRKNVIKKREEIAKLASDKAKENEKIAKAREKIDRANATIKRTKNESTIHSKIAIFQTKILFERPYFPLCEAWNKEYGLRADIGKYRGG